LAQEVPRITLSPDKQNGLSMATRAQAVFAGCFSASIFPPVFRTVWGPPRDSAANLSQ
jgi:hypothetical protein